VANSLIECFNKLVENTDLEIKLIETRSRYLEKTIYEIYIGKRDNYSRLLTISVFKGRPPLYKKWVELYAIAPRIKLRDSEYVYIDSVGENRFIECLSKHIGSGESIFIEYIYDHETMKALELSVPPHLTRLGYLLLKNGFTWLKDWYFPEGFREGAPKLQGEKPLNKDVFMRHLVDICESTRKYKDIINKYYNKYESRYTEIIDKTIARAHEILNDLCRDN